MSPISTTGFHKGLPIWTVTTCNCDFIMNKLNKEHMENLYWHYNWEGYFICNTFLKSHQSKANTEWISPKGLLDQKGRPKYKNNIGKTNTKQTNERTTLKQNIFPLEITDLPTSSSLASRLVTLWRKYSISSLSLVMSSLSSILSMNSSLWFRSPVLSYRGYSNLCIYLV